MNAPLAKEQIALLMSNSLTERDASPSMPRLAGFKRFAAQAVAALRALPRRRAVLNELATLTDRELADIGLNRAELHRVFDPQFRKG